MLPHFGRALRALAVTAALCAAIAPTYAHEGHDDGEQQPVSAGALPRGEADSSAFEIVAIVRGENLEIYLDRFATNEPVIGATLEIESPNGPVKATADADGTYRVAVRPSSRSSVFSAAARRPALACPNPRYPIAYGFPPEIRSACSNSLKASAALPRRTMIMARSTCSQNDVGSRAMLLRA